MSARDFPNNPPREEDESAGDVTGLESEPLQKSAVASPAAPTGKPPLTAEEWKRVLGDRTYRVLVKKEQIEWAANRAVRCAGCTHAGRAIAGSEPWRAVCTMFGGMVSNTFSKLCPAYVPD